MSARQRIVHTRRTRTEKWAILFHPGNLIYFRQRKTFSCRRRASFVFSLFYFFIVSIANTIVVQYRRSGLIRLAKALLHNKNPVFILLRWQRDTYNTFLLVQYDFRKIYICVTQEWNGTQAKKKMNDTLTLSATDIYNIRTQHTDKSAQTNTRRHYWIFHHPQSENKLNSLRFYILLLHSLSISFCRILI